MSDYKPAPLRWPFLTTMIVIMLTLIAVLEYACHVLPAEENRKIIPGSLQKRSSIQYESEIVYIDQNLTFTVTKASEIPLATGSPLSIDFPTSTSFIYSNIETTTSISRSTDDPSTQSTALSGQHAQLGPHTLFSSSKAAQQPIQTGSDDITDGPTAKPTQHAQIGPITVAIPDRKDTKPPLPSAEVQPSVDLVEVLDSTQTQVSAHSTNHPVGGPAMVTGQVTWTGQTTVAGGYVSQYTSTATFRGMLVTGDISYETRSAAVMTMTDSSGVPVAIITGTPPPVFKPTTMTVIENGTSTRVVTTNILVPPRTTTLTNSAGVATATVTEYPTASRTISSSEPRSLAAVVYHISNSQYFVGFFLPTLLAVVLTIPIRMIDMAAKQFQPWRALTHGHGSLAKESLCLRTSGWHGIISSFTALAQGQVLMFLTMLLTLASIILVPLSAEAVALKLHGNCTKMDFTGCAMTLGVFPVPARATIVLLAFMVVIMVLILLALHNWRTGVVVNPWTIAGVASLSSNPELRDAFTSLPTGWQGQKINHKRLLEAFEDKAFKLGYYFSNRNNGKPEYGVMVTRTEEIDRDAPVAQRDDTDGEGSTISAAESTRSSSLKSARETNKHQDAGKKKVERHRLPFLMLSYTGRIAFLLPLTGVLIIILYWNFTGGDTPFNNFMMAQSFGVRALFTLIGVGISFFWSSFFSSLAVLSPYLLLSQSPRTAQDSVILSPPMNAFSGIWSAAKRRHFFLIIVAFTGVLSEFMPVLLNNVPFRVTQTWLASRVCNWLAICILSVMWLVVVGSFFVSWPHMPVDPSTIAGAMYYVCDSRLLLLLGSVEGFSVLSREERDRKMREMMPGVKIRFGNVVGLSGRGRVGVDMADDDYS
ncbi:hypothetical protein QBC44DRAFT_405464 [Cladorrhinum sp. PSN332]|nr:hypothetical protein QBC44DRAFT_405464 [Cladorrhinum sp. PSN332]